MEKEILKKLPYYLQYLISFFIVSIVTIVKIRFFSLIGYKTPFLIYFAVIIIISRLFGKGPAIFSLIIAVVVTAYYFILPFESFNIGSGQLVALLIFILESLLIIEVSHQLTKTLKKKEQNAEWLKAVIEKSSDGIVVVNAEGKRTYCSSSVENIIGYTAEEYLSFEPWKLGHPEELDNIREQYRQLILHPGNSLVLLHRMKHKKGHWIWVESRITNSLNEPLIQSMIANFNDVTERIELEESRKQFVGIVSHELKTPLTVIKAYGELFVQKMRASDDAALLPLATKLVLQTDRIAKMINDMVDVTTIHAGRLELDKRDFDFNVFVYEILENMQETTTSHLLKADLVPIPFINGDKERLSQVIVNLVGNAIKYSPSGGEISITSQKKENMMQVSVRDQGIGIPAQDINKVFERLYRVSNVKNVKGLGLGLYICQQIIQRHDGDIGVMSEEGKGSVFWFTLPLNI